MFVNTDILTIRQYFPSEQDLISSYWVFEQVKGIEKYGLTSIVVSPTPILPDIIRNRLSKKYLKPSIKLNEYRGIKVIRPGYFRIPNYRLYWFTNFLLGRTIVNAVKNLKPKLIHAHFGNDGVAAIPLKRNLGIPLITSFYGYDLSDKLEILRPYYKSLKNEGDLFIALSKDMKKDLLKIGFPESKIVIHHLGVQCKELEAVKKGTCNNRNDFIFLTVARFSERKGIQDTIKAFYYVVSKYPDAKLRIVGDGPYKSELVKLVDRLQLNKSITFIDNFQALNPRKTVLEEMANCDVFILTSYLTSNGSKEGTPIVLMEAQALGKPCISTFHAGIPEVVRHKQTGILVKERDVPAISNAMITFINDSAIVNDFGNNGKLHIYNKFNNEIQIKKLSKLYFSLLASH
jgi:glycosyltransferase involved in cell wall biosynthesis